MANFNWGRLVVGSLVAAVIMFLADGFIHERILSADWQAVTPVRVLQSRECAGRRRSQVVS